MLAFVGVRIISCMALACIDQFGEFPCGHVVVFDVFFNTSLGVEGDEHFGGIEKTETENHGHVLWMVDGYF